MDVGQLLQLNEDELFEQLGSHLPTTRDLSELTGAGRKWFKNNKRVLAELICKDYENLKYKKEIDAAIEIAALIGDAFAGVPVLIIAVIIVKTGLIAICK